MSIARALGDYTEQKSALRVLAEFGQSVWLDYIRRNLITSGELRRLVEQDGLLGVTSNPSIFQKAIAGSTDYTEVLNRLRSQNLSAKEIYEGRAAVSRPRRSARSERLHAGGARSRPH